MEYILINAWPILAATSCAFVFGGLYYIALGRPWMIAAGVTDHNIKNANGRVSPWPYVIAFVAEFWVACILAGALILAPPEAGRWTMALGTALILWVGFVLPTMLVNHRYEGRPLSLTIINGGHWLGVFLILALVLELIGLEPPPGA
ncbi:MAG: DUF1761 domain-containing protein [Pseudomonadota bacterium]